MAMSGNLDRVMQPYLAQQLGVNDSASLVAGAPNAADSLGNVAPPVKRGGMFANGSVGRAALGGLLDSILQQTGGQPVNMPLMMQQRQRQQAMEDWQAKQSAEFAQQMQLARQKATLPSGEFERSLMASGVMPGSPEWAQAMARRVQNQLDPWTNIVVGGNSVMGRQSAVEAALKGGGQASGGPAVGTVEDGYRFKGGDPSDQRNWEPATGGPASLAPAGFSGIGR